MTEQEPVTLRELRELRAQGDHEGRIVDPEDELAAVKARLQRRTNDVATLAQIIRAIARHVDLPLTEVSDGDSVSAPVPESEPG